MPHHQSSYHLHIAADADCTFLTQVCGALASLGLVPEAFFSRLNTAITDRMRLFITLSGVTVRQVDLFERKLLRMTQVVCVERDSTVAADDRPA